MKKLNIIITIDLCVAIGQNLRAQQDPMFTQYWVNPQILNPAHAGADGRTLLNATARNQWINVKGAPQTYTLALGGMAQERLGLGVSYIHDRVGISRTNTLNIDFAYHLPLGEKWKLISSVRVSCLINQLNLTEVNTNTPGDPMFMENLSSGLRPNAGFGFLLASDKFYAGYSQPRIINYDFGTTSNIGNTKIISHRFAYLGYNFNFSEDYKLRPNILVKEVSNAPVQLDFNLVNEFRNNWVVGLSGRTGEGIGVMLGIVNYRNLDIYYCYDYPLTVISLLSKQTHQITLVLNLSKKSIRVNSPRYFN